MEMSEQVASGHYGTAIAHLNTALAANPDDPRLTWCYASPRNGHIGLFSKRSLGILARRERPHSGLGRASPARATAAAEQRSSRPGR